MGLPVEGELLSVLCPPNDAGDAHFPVGQSPEHDDRCRDRDADGPLDVIIGEVGR